MVPSTRLNFFYVTNNNKPFLPTPKMHLHHHVLSYYLWCSDFVNSMQLCGWQTDSYSCWSITAWASHMHRDLICDLMYMYKQNLIIYDSDH